MLNLSNNKIKEIEGISHLEQLAFLDLSTNLIEEIDTEKLPKSIIVMRIQKNKIEPDAYRKKLVVYLDELNELYRIKVV